MSSPAEILASAKHRGAANQLPYAGAVTPLEAYELVKTDANIKLIDVRTNAEQDWVGRATIPDNQYAEIQWSTYPGGARNPDFLTELQRVADKGTVLLFLCRSGVRSRHAAKLAAENGYAQCFDILEGFEGEKDLNGHRKTLNGWCKSGMPWVGA